MGRSEGQVEQVDADEHVAQSGGQVMQVPLIDTVELGQEVEGMQDPEWADMEEELQDRQVVDVLIQVEHDESHSIHHLSTCLKGADPHNDLPWHVPLVVADPSDKNHPSLHCFTHCPTSSKYPS